MPGLSLERRPRRGLRADCVVFGSRLHAGKIEALRPALRMLEASNVKKIFVFVTGAMPDPPSQELETIWNSNFLPSERGRVEPYYLPGGLRYERMGAMDRFMMAGLRFALRHSRGDDKKAMLKAIEQSYDIHDFGRLDPLVAAVRAL